MLQLLITSPVPYTGASVELGSLTRYMATFSPQAQFPIRKTGWESEQTLCPPEVQSETSG